MTIRERLERGIKIYESQEPRGWISSAEYSVQIYSELQKYFKIIGVSYVLNKALREFSDLELELLLGHIKDGN